MKRSSSFSQVRDIHRGRSPEKPFFTPPFHLLFSATEEKDKNRLKVEGGKGIPPKVAERPRHSSFSNIPKGFPFFSFFFSFFFFFFFFLLLLFLSGVSFLFFVFFASAFDADKMIPLRKSSLPIDPIYVTPRGSRTNQSRRRALARSAFSSVVK